MPTISTDISISVSTEKSTQLTNNWTYYADTVNTCISNTGITTPRPPHPRTFFCTHANTDVYTYSRYKVPLILYSNLMMAS